MTDFERIGGSFRDPSGSVFLSAGNLYRQVNHSYREHYDQLMQGGLHEDLVKRELLVSHEEIDHHALQQPETFKVLQPQRVPFISYPYEWSFSQLKDAALAMLDIQRRALAFGMTLKDASAYNIQFLAGKPVLIDTLSFERYQEGKPWVAYRQFCQHFLAPLALMSYKDVRLSQLFRVYMDGIPLDLAQSLMPARSTLNLGIAMHLQLHARAQHRHSDADLRGAGSRRRGLRTKDLLNIVDNLRSTISGLRWNPAQTDWADYYAGDSYRDRGFESKHQTVSNFIDRVKPKCLWDLGANTGAFSRIASEMGSFTISIDNDPGAVEANYLQAKRDQVSQLHPLLIDLTNPSAAIGWANKERDSLAARCKADCVLALALIHHLAISNNVPLGEIAAYFASLAEWLIIEFVPKSDKKVQQLLASREDIFSGYSREGFEREFGRFYDVVETARVADSERILYLTRRR